ncbi:MAG: C39 family peptidase [Methanobrevibacter sp.]|nr:C39 family peptidase [Methanobrevibacter sp.]
MGFLDWIKYLFTNNKKMARFITKNITKTFGEKEQLEVALFEGENPLSDRNVNISINGMTYVRKTDENGIARLNINLGVGEYKADFEFMDDDFNLANAFCKVFVNPVISTQDMNMTEKDGSQFIAIATSSTGVRLSGVPIIFNINGVDYKRTSDMVGEAKLNINLGKGTYEITTSSLKVSAKNIIHIDEKPKKVTRMEGVNISKAFSDKTAYQCAVYDDNSRVSGTVVISVNGVDYTKTPDSTGLYKLNINLQPGTYQISAQYMGDNEHLPSQIVNTIHIVADPVKTVYNPIRIKYQPNSYTCGPTSLSMCSQILGNEVSINSFANACYTDGSGTSPSNLIAGARKLGFKVTPIGRSYAAVKKAIDAGKPVIAHVMTKTMKCLGWQGNYGHYVVIYDYDNGYYHVADPTKGISWCYKDQVDGATIGYEGIQYYSVERI